MHLEIACDESGFLGGNLVGGDGTRSLPVRRAELRTNALAGLHDLGWQSLSDQQQMAPEGAVPMFYAAVNSMARTRAPTDVTKVMTQLQPTQAIAEATRASYLGSPKLTPLMEPLLPAFSRAVHHWGSQAQTLAVVHDEQSALTSERVADIATAFTAEHRGHRLTDVRFANSSREPAVQIADFVAGIARRLGSDELKGRADPHIVALLRPLIDHEFVWVDQTRSTF